MLVIEENQTMSQKSASTRPATDQPRLMTRLEAAAWLGVSKQYLAALASKNEGPPYKVLGRKAMYMSTDLHKWWEQQTYANTPGTQASAEVPKKEVTPKPAPKSLPVRRGRPPKKLTAGHPPAPLTPPSGYSADPQAFVAVLQQMLQALQNPK